MRQGKASSLQYLSYNIEGGSFLSAGAILISSAFVIFGTNMVPWELNLSKSNGFSSSSNVSALSNSWWLSLFFGRDNKSFYCVKSVRIRRFALLEIDAHLSLLRFDNISGGDAIQVYSILLEEVCFFFQVTMTC